MSQQTAETGGVGYVLRKFPVLSETFILNEILELERQGVRVHVFALAPPRDPRFHEGLARLKASITYVPGILEAGPILRQNRKLWKRHPARYRRELLSVLLHFNPKLLWRFLQAGYVADRARRLQLDHLHAHFANRATTVARFASRLLKIPYSFTAHAFDIYRRADPRVIVKKVRDAKAAVTVSEYNVRYLRSLLGKKTGRIELVRNGIDTSHFAPAPHAPDGAFTILAVARLVEKKGLPVLIEACGLLRDRGVDFRCNVVGKGKLRSALEKRIAELRLSGRVHLLGPHTQDEIVARFHEAHVVALPCIVGEDGNRDGLPVSIIEALSAGLPVVSTPVTGIPEAVRDGENGLLVKEGDPVSLADALERLAREPELRERLAAAARPSVVSDYDQAATACKLREIFEGELRAREQRESIPSEPAQAARAVGEG